MENIIKAAWLHVDPVQSSVIFKKKIEVGKDLAAASLEILGYGLYEVYVDGIKAGDEYLMPGYQSYDLIQEYQTLDLTGILTPGTHELSVLLGNGWYRGRFVFEGGYENLYGDHLKLIAALTLTYANGSDEIIITDKSWSAETSSIGENNIYDGEVQDETLAGKPVSFTADREGMELLTPRSNPRILEMETLSPKDIIHTPAGEIVLDFGTMITGWVRVHVHEPAGTVIVLRYGEILQDGNFFQGNLRTAKARFEHTSTGRDEIARPHFTFYGFRYVKVEGITDVRADDFEAARIYSEMELIGHIETGHAKVNQLIENALTSQKCNFLDVPTDCPQRDERMGWTGDIALFSETASFHMDTSKMLGHYLKLMKLEQDAVGGAVPIFVPRPKVDLTDNTNMVMMLSASGLCAWGDAGVVIPWTLYEHYRDKKALSEQYPVMKHWVEYVNRRTDENPVPHLWQNDLQLGDWLSLDNEEVPGPFGKTDTGYLASAWHYHATILTWKAAQELGYTEDEAELAKEAKLIKEAIQKTYLNEDGTLNIPETQTAYAILLMFGLYREGQEKTAVSRLKALVEAKDNHLDTGFVGTPYLCQALSEFGEHRTACRILLNESYPGWLHEINLGAVSMWERWNSVEEDGHLNPEGMNSLNHYAYGSIVAWMYKYLCGFRFCRKLDRGITIAPMPCRKLGWLKGSLKTPWGTYRVSWKVEGEGFSCEITVPEGAFAKLRLTGQEEQILEAGVHTIYL